MRFGTPPLFNFAVVALVLCIIHTLLRLVAVTFQRTILVNLDTQEKVDAVNKVIANLHLGCKKLELQKTSGERRKDTNACSFTGRYDNSKPASPYQYPLDTHFHLLVRHRESCFSNLCATEILLSQNLLFQSVLAGCEYSPAWRFQVRSFSVGLTFPSQVSL